MPKTKSVIKSKIKQLIHFLPWGRDIYLSLAGPRLGICYRGVFESIDAAKAHLAKSRDSEYDKINRLKGENIDHEVTTLDDWFHDVDYPLLFWLSQLVNSSPAILELGGSVGHFYYTSKHYFSHPEQLQWTIAELPEAVRLGREIAAQRGERGLEFVDSAESATFPAAGIFLTAGTVQYMEEDLVVMLSRLSRHPDHVLIHNLPMHRDRSFWTLQNLGVCELPYRIYAYESLCEGMRNIGYELRDRWNNPRELEIPFHSNLVIEGYLGMYFRKI